MEDMNNQGFEPRDKEAPKAKEAVVESKTNKKKLIFIIVLIGVVIALGIFLCIKLFKTEKIDLSEQAEYEIAYRKAFRLIENGEHEEAYRILKLLGDFKDAEEHLAKFRYLPTRFYNDYGIYIEDNIVVYDSNGLPKKHIFEYSGEDEYVYEYTYSEDGRLLREIDNYSNGDKTIFDYTYNAKGDLIREVYTYSDGDKRETTYLHTYDGDRISQTVEHSAFGTVYTYNYTYDAEGNLIREAVSWSSGKTNVFDYEYENGKLVKETRNVSGEIKTYIYTYNENGQLSEAVLRKNTSVEFALTYEYDSDGNLIRIIEQDNGGDMEIQEITYGLVYTTCDLDYDVYLDVYFMMMINAHYIGQSILP